MGQDNTDFQLHTAFLKDGFRSQVGNISFISSDQVEQDVRKDILEQRDNFGEIFTKLNQTLDNRKLSNDLRV